MTKPRGKHLLRQGPSTDARPGSELGFAQCFRCGKCCQTANLDANDLFVDPPPPADKTKQILDVIADPGKSHFFNTDCVSCHTETRRTIELLNTKDIPGIDPAALPTGSWDVRNFGWAPPAGKGAFHAEVTRRTAAETTAVV